MSNFFFNVGTFPPYTFGVGTVPGGNFWVGTLPGGNFSGIPFKYSLVEVMSFGKNALSVLREWKKPYVKTSMFHDILI